jgi:hypothetical protein
MTKIIYCDKKLDADHRLGQFMEKSDFDVMINEDCNIYGPSLDGSCTEDNILAVFRKGYFTDEEQQLAYDGLREAATESQNRGIAAGPRGEILGASGRGGREWVTPYQMDVLEFLLRPTNQLSSAETLEDIKIKHSGKKPVEDTRGLVWKIAEIRKDKTEYYGWFDRWLEEVKDLSRDDQIKQATYVKDKYISETNYAQSVMSGIAGYYGRYPRIPFGRPTSYTEKFPDKFAMCFPFLKKLNQGFKEFLPNRWAAQKAAASKLDPRFLISDTVFTTLTVNHNWRTAAHYDAGDLLEGFSNLAAITNKKKGWKGAELVLPQYRAAVKVEAGDLLLIANHTAIHGNLAFDPEFDNDRISIVAYFREDMLGLKSWEYENLRRQFVIERSKNKNHPYYRPLWNGVSPGMWESQEWADYLSKNGMVDEDGLVGQKVSSLTEFFNV